MPYSRRLERESTYYCIQNCEEAPEKLSGEHGVYGQNRGVLYTVHGTQMDNHWAIFRGRNVNLGMTIMTMGPGKLWVSVAPESRAGLNGIDSLLYTSRGRHIDLPRPNVAKSQSFIWRVLVMVSW